MNVPSLTEQRIMPVIQTVRSLANGATNALGSVTLTNGATTTTVVDERVRTNTVPVLVPFSAAAASEAWWISAVVDGQFTITHANAATTRTFRCELRYGDI